MPEDKLDEMPASHDSEALESIIDVLSIVFGGVPGVSTMVSAFERSVHRILRAKDRAYLQSVFERLQERLNQHEERLDELNEDRLTAFVTALLYTREIARTTTDQDKLLALRNEAVNSAMSGAPGDDLRQLYIAMTATLTGLHLRIFGFLAKPEVFGAPIASWRELEQYQGDGPWATHTWDIVQRYVAGAPDRELIQHCFTDLVNQGVVAYRGGPLPGITFPLLTNLGWSYYAFIVDEDITDERAPHP